MNHSKIFLIAALFIVVALISGFTLFLSPSNVTVTNDYPTYDKQWKEVDSLINNGLPQSALKLTEKIYQMARDEGNHPQFIRSMIYKIKLNADFEEAFIEKSVEDIQMEIKTAQMPAKQILHSMLADLYWRYYSANRYKFFNRTQLVIPDLKDISTWDLNTITSAVIDNYKLSLEPKKELVAINLKSYDAILLTSKESKTYRPTLYDFLAHRAVDFFMNEEAAVSSPAYRFETDSEEFFAAPLAFVNLDLETRDTLSLSFYGYKTLQQLEALHLDDPTSEALTDVFLKRMNFSLQKSILTIKDSLYLEGFKNYEKAILSDPSSTHVSYDIAQALYRKGQQYKPLAGTNFQWDIKTAVEKCNEAISRFPESDGAQNCTGLLQILKRPEYKIKLESENIPDQSALALVSFKNIQFLNFRLIKVDFEEDRDFRQDIRSNEALIEKYLTYPVVQQWKQDFPDAGDYQLHAAEIEIPAMPAGYYILLASNSPEFEIGKAIISFQPFWSTSLSFVSQTSEQKTGRFFVLDRQSGKPLKNVKVEMFYRNYDYRSRSYLFQPGQLFISDAQGSFEIPASSDNSRPNTFFLKLSTKDDLLITGDRFYQSPYVPVPDRKSEQTVFFTDRAIYRPGQIIYFKGIVLEKGNSTTTVKKSFSTTVEFMDANYQKITELKLQTNEYGSFSGSFIAPSEGLNGQMTLKNNSGSLTIRVEEYKRPTFEVKFSPVEGSYKLGEMLELIGEAKAYAGNSLDGAQVKYRVVRNTYFPWRGGFGYFDYFPGQSSMEITNGITQTGSDGKFIISFEAIPDYSVAKKYNPVYDYQVMVDVTDISNETQSGESHVKVGYQALFIEVNLPERISSASFGSIPLKTSNLNGQAVAASGKVTLSLLSEKSWLSREKLWPQADVFVMNKETYLSKFPGDSYEDETDLDKRKVSEVIKTFSFQTPKDSILSFEDIKNWKPGKYRIEVESKDEYGEPVKLKKYVTVFSKDSKTTPENEPGWFQVIKSSGEPGEQASFLIGSRYSNVQVLFEMVHQGKIIRSEWMKLNKEQKLIEIPLLKEYTEPADVLLIFVKDNRVYNFGFELSVPDLSHKLDVELTTFRNKLLPGQEEEWSLKIRGAKGEKLAAELLVSMYDRSLDQFQKNTWSFNPFTNSHFKLVWNTRDAFGNLQQNILIRPEEKQVAAKYLEYDQLNWFGFTYYGDFSGGIKRGGRENILYDVAATPAMEGGINKIEEVAVQDGDLEYKDKETSANELTPTVENKSTPSIRRDFNETAFFFPQLKTDEAGNVSFSFKVPESLTAWNFMGIAHTADLKYDLFQKEVLTQKDLMVIANPPRFFRKGDQMKFSAKVVNLNKETLSGTAELQFFNTLNMEDITDKIMQGNKTITFETKENASQNLSWEIKIPDDFDMISYRISATAGSFTDGEEKPIPVLSNRMLVTESLPLPVNGGETKTFRFEKLIKANSAGGNTTLKNHQLTLEFSSNPAWYAIQALPYLMETTNESADAIFTRFYANAIGSYLVNKNPKIKRVFDAWKAAGKEAFLSNLEKNQELKQLMLNETPWVRDAQNEAERKQRVALLFDINTMSQQQNSALRKLIQKQSPGGGWAWYKGMPDNRYITQQIVTGFGHLKQMGVLDGLKDESTRAMLTRAIRATDQMLKDDYELLISRKEEMETDHLGNIQIQYLYARSLFMNDLEPARTFQVALDFYIGQAKKYWVKRSIYDKGMIALALNRLGDKEIPSKIMASIKEHALYSDEMGMYWRDNQGGYYWYEAPIETQALLIEAFAEVSNDKIAVEKMKTWLLKQKQTQDWKTPKATAEAVYALMLQGSDWLVSNKLAEITIGGQLIDPFQRDDTKIEAGTGYFKTKWSGSEITPEMGTIKVSNKNENVAWGAVYWQYFEQLDKITFAETPLKIKKQLFIEKNTPSGPVLEIIENNQKVKTGDKIVVRIELRVDRTMEFVHMKDMRASAFEPINTLSGYNYQGGLGYYQSTLDASTDFFFDWISKGTYVFEYTLVASQKGDFSNGITTIQCMYAPEFTSHSEGVRVVVE